MFKIRGMYEALSYNCISLRDEHYRAKYRMLHGEILDDLDFEESLDPTSSRVACGNVIRFTFLYKVPTYDMNYLDFSEGDVKSVASCIKTLYIFSRMGSTIDRLSDVYNSITYDINHMICKVVHKGRKLYESESMDIYCGFRETIGYKLGLIIGVSGEDVLFVTNFNITHNLDIFNFENVVVTEEDGCLNFELVSHDFIVGIYKVRENGIGNVTVRRK